MSLKPPTKILMQIYICNNFFNLQKSTKCFLFSFNCNLVSFCILSLRLSSITFNCPGKSLYSGGHCIPMSHESSLENSCPNAQLIHTVHSAVLRHMLLGILIQPGSHVGSKPWHQSSPSPISFSLPSECSETCTLSQKDLNLLDNTISLNFPSPPPVTLTLHFQFLCLATHR